MISYHAILDCKPSKWERIYLEVLKNNDCRSLFILDSKTRKWECVYLEGQINCIRVKDM